jgi:hypothetical protein
MDSPSAAPAALSGRKVALLGGFLLLGALAFAIWLLLGASPASAQSDHGTAATGSSTTAPGAAPEPAGQEPAPADGSNEFRLPPLPIDLPALTQQTLPPVTRALPPPLQPVASDVVEVLPSPVRAPIAPLVAQVAPPPVAAAPSNPPSGAPVGGDPATNAAPPGPHAASEQPVLHAHRAELRPADATPSSDGTRAPPTGVPPVGAASGSSVSNSLNDSGSSLLLFGVLIAGVAVLLGGGRRLLIEAPAWLPSPWSALPERPG